ncbi:SAM-dependent methyltransferase [Sphingomonas naasensis]|uniref:Class I SAM-dependent methyltransferase n=1 Tax=Sphingomonas naasensis TaxID=1344951 RepID=A0A4S1WID8_9SPHN|nr:class I SAM-dependent methyltransferase [Sphingomonas naasensis]NIJ21849.1 SAM-dependent methyltransferase [Sphingomonas naasensis]TGX42453.1 class I SAM-dependent methyltransferase [Sphingomonas naasensis]
MDEVLADYAASATPELIAGYDSLSPEQIYAAVRDFLPRTPVRIADIGAGTGRDAAWFAGQGHRVLAVEPVQAFRAAGAALHGDRVTWLDDQLPRLAGLPPHAPFELVLLCAVWHHLDPAGRACAMPVLAGVLTPGGRLILSLRHDPNADGRLTFPAPSEEAIALAREAGLDVTHQAEAESVHAESRANGVRWTWLVLTKRG